MHLYGVDIIHLIRKLVINSHNFCNFENFIGFKMPATFYEVPTY